MITKNFFMFVILNYVVVAIKNVDSTPICFFEVLGNRVVQIQNEAHVKDVSVKLHSLYYFLKVPKFRKSKGQS